VELKVRGIRGATIAKANTEEAIASSVEELLQKIEQANQLQPEDIVCVFFTATADLDAIFPAKAARIKRPHWQYVPLLDLQQMKVEGDLPRCIRILIQVNTTKCQSAMVHCYLEATEKLRPDLKVTEVF
jgi:chorismate mutase